MSKLNTNFDICKYLCRKIFGTGAGYGRKRLSSLQAFQMTEQQIAVLVAQVHAVAPAIAEEFALSAIALAHPFAVAIRSEAACPHIPEIVAVYVALPIVGANARACGNRTVDKHRSDRHAGTARIQMVADIALVIAEEAFATVTDLDATLAAGALYELHHAAELPAGELQIIVLRRTPHGKYGEYAPLPDAHSYQHLFQFVELRIVAAVGARYDIEPKIGFGCHRAYGIDRTGETLRIAAHEVMFRLQSVQTYRSRMHTCIAKRTEPLRRHIKTVGYHTPRKAPLIDCATALLQIVAHERLAARNDYEHAVGVGMCSDIVEYAQEIVFRHIGESRRLFAVAAAVAAMQIAAHRTLPEELAQTVFAHPVVFEFACYFECNAATEREFAAGHRATPFRV